VIAICGCAAAPAPAPRTPTPSAQAPTEEEEERAWLAERERELSTLRQNVLPVIDAFRKRDQRFLREWATNRSQPAAFRTYAAYLLLQLGADGANQLFVANFPVDDLDQYLLFDDLREALDTPATDDVQLSPQQVLICGAVHGWNGAADKLIELRSILDGSEYMDNCCGLIRLTIAHPDEALARMATTSVEDGLLHVFEEEASPAEAAQLLRVLASRTYTTPQQEQLRLQLIAVLTEKAKADGPTEACEWLKCSGDAKAPPN
jgi:hypothetical protein